MNKYTTVEYRGINFEVSFHKEDIYDEYIIWSIFVEGSETDIFDMLNDVIDRSSKLTAASEIEILAREKLSGEI